ncbi:TIGR03546 family protein [Treponema parvum]|uniref:TIGR03546 family protein n=1 Tax=Treponema parvum TaxID=138851 RepID=A0A975ICV4_9SPIR|nr:TIGR03546 family protein [Treponema parvum]QTQ12192.1 TIGR03546 family protein [Treponema parvum]QTQ17349.1 TIGR03546 family protein [Treponema parvum]
MIRYIIKLFKALNANTNPNEIAHAFGIGFMLGLMPKTNLLWYLLFIFFLLLRINKGAYFLILLLFSFAAPVFDPLLNSLGYAVLKFAPLEGLFATLLDIPFVGFTRFNNTIVMGSLVLGIIAYVPMFILGRLFIVFWRKVITPKIKQNPIMKAFYKIPLVGKIKSLVTEIN